MGVKPEPDILHSALASDITAAQNVRNLSDLYLELRSRIPVVADQTTLGTQRIQDAQDAVGLSNEGVARKIPVSEKTWRRWKQSGSIPTSSLPAVARALRLDLRALSPEATEEDRLDRLEAQLGEVLALVQQLRDELLGRPEAHEAAS